MKISNCLCRLYRKHRMVEPNYYEILGVSKNSDAVVIQAAYKALMRKYHPDINKDINSHEKSVLINEAFEILNDSEKRIQYDINIDQCNNKSQFIHDENEQNQYNNEDYFNAEIEYMQVCEIVFSSKRASASWIQRKMGIGYNTAARFIERMEFDGLISPSNDVGYREVYDIEIAKKIALNEEISNDIYRSNNRHMVKSKNFSILGKLMQFYRSSWGIHPPK